MNLPIHWITRRLGLRYHDRGRPAVHGPGVPGQVRERPARAGRHLGRSRARRRRQPRAPLSPFARLAEPRMIKDLSHAHRLPSPGGHPYPRNRALTRQPGLSRRAGSATQARRPACPSPRARPRRRPSAAAPPLTSSTSIRVAVSRIFEPDRHRGGEADLVEPVVHRPS